MQTVSVPWKAWHGDQACELSFPGSWKVETCPMRDAPRVSAEEIDRAFLNPIGCQPLEHMAKGKRRIAIAVDDISRPTPTQRLLPLVLARLKQAGATEEQITIVVALGSHAPLSDWALEQKLGRAVIQGYRIVQHDASQNLDDLGLTLDGIPVKINKEFLAADFKLSMGGITPHPFAGFSGGGKLILPGLANIEIIERTHRYVVMGFRGGLGQVEGNQFREEVERVCRKCQVDMIVDVVVNHAREIAGVFIGDVQLAFLQGVAFARQIYRTALAPSCDIVVLNAYPKDTDLVQSENALNILRSTDYPIVNDHGTIVLLTASSHGIGTHGLFSPDGRLYHRPVRKRWLRDKGLIVYAPEVSEEDVRRLYWKGYPFCQGWEEVLKALKQRHPDGGCRVGVFPCSAIQLGETP